MPRTWSATSRHFCGEMRAQRSLAVTSMLLIRALRSLASRPSCRRECALNVRVGANSPSLWPTMFSVTSTGHVLAAVVDGDREADHLRHDHRAARPGLDRLAVVLRRRRPRTFFEQVQIDERAFLE